MLITKRQFFSGKGRKKQIYNKYFEDANEISSIGEEWIRTYKQFLNTMEEYRQHTHMYEYLCKVRDSITCLAEDCRAYYYDDISSCDFKTFTFRDWSCRLKVDKYKLVTSMTKMKAAIQFTQWCQENDLSLRVTE
jgi:hypothetical protein